MAVPHVVLAVDPRAEIRGQEGVQSAGVPARKLTGNPPGVHSAGEPGPVHATAPLLSPEVSGVAVRLALYTAPVEPAAMFFTATVADVPKYAVTAACGYTPIVPAFTDVASRVAPLSRPKLLASPAAAAVSSCTVQDSVKVPAFSTSDVTVVPAPGVAEVVPLAVLAGPDAG